MSIAFHTDTFSIDSETVPEALSSKAEIINLRNSAYQRIKLAPSDSFYIKSKYPKETLHFVQGSTRMGWAIYTLSEVLESMNFPALAFLTNSGYQQAFKEEGSITKVTILRNGAEKQAIAELHGLIVELLKTPEVVTLAAAGYGSNDEVIEALKRDYVSPKPHLDENVFGDEGEGLDYLFVYLRSILAVLENADKQGLITIHVLEHPN